MTTERKTIAIEFSAAELEMLLSTVHIDPYKPGMYTSASIVAKLSRAYLQLTEGIDSDKDP